MQAATHWRRFFAAFASNTGSDNTANGDTRLITTQRAANEEELGDRLGRRYCVCTRARILIGTIIGLGIIARVAQYLANRSLWLDEAMLALNIVHRSFGGLLQPLDNDQAAPIGFVMLEKLAIQIFGANEYALRLAPLLAGIFGLLLCYPVAKQFISPAAATITVGLFAILDPLVYYSSEVKQYSSDVAIALVLLWVGMKAEQKGWKRRWLLLFTVIGAISVWFSYPAVFVLAGMGGVLLIAHLRRNGIRIALRLSIAFVIAALSFAVFYLLFLRHTASNQNLFYYWKGSFMPFPPASVSQAHWIPSTFLGIFRNLVKVGLPPGLGAFLFLVGGIVLFVSARQRFFVLVSPILLTLVASALHLYPFAGRLILFLVPVFLLLIAEGIVQLAGRTHQRTVLIRIVVLAFVFQPVLLFGKALIRPRTREEIKPVLDYISRYHEDQDVIYVYHAAQPAFEFYAPRYNLTHNILIGVDSRAAPENYSHDLERVRGQVRVWVLFSHIYTKKAVRREGRLPIQGMATNEETIFLNTLDRLGARRDSFRSPGAAGYLYDLSDRK